jgi:hypothetical protein
MARKTIKQLEADLLEAVESRGRYCDRALKAEQEAKAAGEAAKEVREQFADLKRRLHEAEVENARISGYLERVHEGDIARDGMVEIKEGDEARLVPKWPSRRQEIHTEPDFNFDQYGKQKKHKHWTEY